MFGRRRRGDGLSYVFTQTEVEARRWKPFLSFWICKFMLLITPKRTVKAKLFLTCINNLKVNSQNK